MSRKFRMTKNCQQKFLINDHLKKVNLKTPNGQILLKLIEIGKKKYKKP